MSDGLPNPLTKEPPMPTTLAARAGKKQAMRAALAAAPAAWTRQAATRKATTVPVAGRDVDPRDIVATLLHGVATQQLTAQQVADVLHVLGWQRSNEDINSLVLDAIDRMYLLADLDAGNIEVRQESPLPGWYPANDHGQALRDVALQDLAGFVTLLARRDNLLRRGDVVVRDDTDAAVIETHLGKVSILCHCPDDVLANHPTLRRFTALMPGLADGVWRSWDTLDDVRSWARAYGVHVEGSPTEPGQSADLRLPGTLTDLAPLTCGGLVVDP